MNNLCLLCLCFLLAVSCNNKQFSHTNKPTLKTEVIGYYSGNADNINQYPVEKLTQIIYSFCHLKGNRLNVDNAADTATIKQLVLLKNRNPQLKVLLSLGGWGGCKTCSDVFSTDAARKEFASSVKELTDYFKTDGIDLDWEYPAIEGHPGHPFMPADKDNFTFLVRDLRHVLGTQAQISFAAGGFDNFINNSIDWKAIEPLVNNVNLMSYDLVSGFSTVTGHHTPLYSTTEQSASADNAIKKLAAIGFPKNKIVLGCGFYARTWGNVEDVNNGLYQSGKFISFIDFKMLSTRLSTDSGYVYYWDDVAKATHAFNKEKKIFATFDDERSVKLKTEYVKSEGLYGIMFWELATDKPKNGLLSVIDHTLFPLKN